MHLNQTNHNNKGGAQPKRRMVYEEKKQRHFLSNKISLKIVDVVNVYCLLVLSYFHPIISAL